MISQARPVRLLPAAPRPARARPRGRAPRSAGRQRARALLPPGRGRGSSVSSVVCYLTGLSHVDPVKAGLFLGRFLNDEITEAPDIDLDFPRDVREQLIPRIHERYGRRALGAGRRLPHLPLAGRGPRPRQGARPAERRDRAGRALGRRLRRPARSSARSPRRSASARARLGALAGADRARARGPGTAPPRLPAPGRDGPLHPAADRPLPGRARRRWRDGRSPSGTRTPAPTRAFSRSTCSASGCSRRSSAPSTRSRGRGRAHRPLADPARRRARSTGDPARPRRPASSRSRAGPRCRCCRARCPRTSTTSPSRSRSSGPARSRAAPSIPTSSARGGCARTPPTRFPTSTRRWSRSSPTRSARSSSRTR